MSRKTKVVSIDGEKVTIKQLSAMDGCTVIQNYTHHLEEFTRTSTAKVVRLTAIHYLTKSPTRALYAILSAKGASGIPDALELLELLLEGSTDANGEQYTVDWLFDNPMKGVLLLIHIISFNFGVVWLKNDKRHKLADSAGEDDKISKVSLKAKEQYSQPELIYYALKSERATMADLTTHLSTQDAYDLYETLTREYTDNEEIRKQAEREAQRN